MDVLLVRLPGADDEGQQVERVSAVLLGDDVTPKQAAAVKDWLMRSQSEPAVLVSDRACVQWL